MVGLVVVRHSRRLARAAVALAVEMVAEEAPPIEVAAGSCSAWPRWSRA